MRSCIYCGRELEKGEICGCPQSAAYRARKNKSAGGQEQTQKTQNTRSADRQNYQNPYKTETSYRTGYAGKESRFERAKNKFRARRSARKAAAAKADPKGFFKSLWRYVMDFLKSPLDRTSNPAHLGKAGILTIAAVQGAVLWLCMFFIVRGGSIGPFKLIASMMSFGGGEGYRLVASVFLVIASGAVGGIVMFFLYSGIFYLINRYIMRLRTPYWEFCVRLAATWIPFTAVCLIGALLSLLSRVTLVVLILCGAASAAVLTYEALKTEWISQSPVKVLYSMLLGYFVFFSILCRLALI